jgi:putative N6-adenine-specific DNA methylase/tRNA (guanine6-N2)-methyltransferase
MRYLLTTDPGIESIVVDELRERGAGGQADPCPYETQGHVRVDGAELDELRRLRTIHHIVEIRREARAATLEEIEAVLGEIDFPELNGAESFRVTTERQGKHPFRSTDVQRVAGAAIFRQYGTRVDLERFEVEVRVNLYGDRVVAGIQETRDSLGNRILRARALRSSLKPTIAAAMLRLVGAHRGEGRLIDPMCGTGTIPIEARQANPRLQVQASDWDDETVEVARATIHNHGLEIEVDNLDARTLGQGYPERFDYIVTDPPYGVRQARRVSMVHLYETLLPSLERALAPRGLLAIVVVKYRAFLAALEPTGLRVVDERLIDVGGLHPRIFVLERR